jgi:predicted transposase/invertase (TIGR01784 family)
MDMTTEYDRKPLLHLKNDYVFRRVFTRPDNEAGLASFLKSVLRLPDDEFSHLEIADPNLYRPWKGGKGGELDVRVHTASGKIVNVEIQLNYAAGFGSRAVYYASRLVDSQLAAGGHYTDIKHVVSIVITDFVLIREDRHYHHRFNLYDKEKDVLLTDILEINVLESPKLPQESDHTALWDWMKLIGTEDDDEVEALAKKNPELEQTVMIVREMSQDEAERRLAEAREKQDRDTAAYIEHGVYVGRQEGLEQGLEQGREQGLEQGLEQGREQGMRQKAIEVASNFKALAVEPAIIAKATGLSLDEIMAL